MKEGQKAWKDMSATEKRQDTVNYLISDGFDRLVVFGCDNCEAVDTCEWAFDPWNLDGDCLAEK